jgi:hypothetical protein
MKTIVTMGIIMVLLLAGMGTVSANLVANPSFEQPTAAIEFTGNMETGLIGWTIEEGGNIDLIGIHWLASDQAQSIDLSGCQRATISQEIITDPSQTYQLSFALSGNPYIGDTSSKIRTVEVYWDDDSAKTYNFDTSVITNQKADMHWDPITIPGLQATSTTTMIKFKDVSPNSNICVGVALDDIAVEKEGNNVPVPEFPTLALPIGLIVGLIGAILFIRQSKEN